ncbi:MAG: YdiU family protein [Microthrixaceae bacterium]
MSESEHSTAAAVAGPMGPLAGLGHRFLDELPELCLEWSGAEVPSPELVVLNDGLAAELDLDAAALRSAGAPGILAGSTAPEGSRPVALAYAGHQFGNYSPRLGDGRALLLGELSTPAGTLVDVHLKGSGRTPFARGGDGRATIGPMLREYLVSEFMHSVGVPTTRSLAVVTTGEMVRRDRMEPGAVLTRTAASHIRVGTFEYALRLGADGAGSGDLVARLARHSIERHYPGLLADEPSPGESGVGGLHERFLEAVVEAQASLIARWMLVGFIHGVMNTDNTTISGETIDYGPCAFIDRYDPTTGFSSIDHAGRYAFANQPAIASWNLARVAETLLEPIARDRGEEIDAVIEPVTEIVRSFAGRFQEYLGAGMALKLGLRTAPADDPTLFDDLLAVMHHDALDWTLTFRSLANRLRSPSGPVRVAGSWIGPGTEDPSEEMAAWQRRWRSALDAEGRRPDEVADAMDAANPLYIPRNHLVEEALEAANEGELGAFEELLDVLGDPFTERGLPERFARPAPPGFTEGYRTFCGT